MSSQRTSLQTRIALRTPLLLLFAAFCLLVWTLAIPRTPVDDAYITFGYVRHLVQGHGLVFNLGEPPLEGYSSLLWVLVLAPFQALGLDLALTAQALGIVLGLSVIWAVAAGEQRPRWFGAVGLVVCLPWLYHTVNGLETALVAALIAALTCIAPTTAARRRLLFLVAAVLPLARPEGLLAVLAWAAATQLAAKRLDRDAIFQSILAGTTFLAQLCFRFAYHHAWIANSARAKLMPPLVSLPPGLLDLGRFFLAAGGLGLAVALVLWAAIRGPSTDGTPRPRTRALFLLGFAPLLATSGGDSFPLWRFFVPIAPVLFATADDGLQAVLAARALQPRTRVLAHALAGVVLLTLLLLPWQFLLPMVALEGDWVTRWSAIGERLGEILPPTTTIALAPVGALPWQSHFRTIDLLGLNDAHIAGVPADTRYFYPGHQRHDGPYVLSRKPDLIFLANGPLVTRPEQPFPWQEVRVYEQDLLADPRFQAEYGLVAIPLRPGLFLQIFARTDFARQHAWPVLPGLQARP